MINNILSKCNLWLIKIFPRPFESIAVKGKELVGIEIGVYEGTHARSMLKTLNIRKLYLIDPERNGKIDGLNFDRRVQFIKAFSEDVKDDFTDNSLDFVYIDGNHSYKNVKQDIENYYPKIKQGGIIGGHDFFNGVSDAHDGVIQAVIDFAVKNELILNIQRDDWWIKK